jgi:RNA polymerase sigma-70 factor (ECF subfamily)
LLTALRARQSDAWEMLFKSYGPYVERLVVRVIGFDSEVPDLIDEVFLRALEGVDRLKDAAALKSWLGSVALFTARAWLRNRTSRRRWLDFREPDDIPDVPGNVASPEVSQTLQRTYALLAGIPVDDRIAFALRYINSMELTEIAQILGISLSTTKRRISRAEQLFLTRANKDPVLAEVVIDSERWRSK